MKPLRAALASAILAAGCNAPQLRPAPNADFLAPGAARAAGGEVRMAARAGAWQGMPPALEQAVTPMLMHLANDSAHPIRIDYERLALVSGDGQRFRAIPPQAVSGLVTFGLDVERPRLGGQPLRQTREGREVRLPTLDMLRKALHDGVLEPGGVAVGFVYFEKLDVDTRRVELRAEFPDAAGAQVTRLQIPFVIG